MFAKTKTFSPMRTVEIGIPLFLIGILFFISILFVQSVDAIFFCGLATLAFGPFGFLLMCMDSRFLKEDWEVKEIEARWAKKKRIMTEKKRWEEEKKRRRTEAERLQKQNGKAKH